MTPEKWKELMEKSHSMMKPHLYLYRAYVKHPWRVYAFYLAICVAAFANFYADLKESGSSLSAFVFFVGFGPVFFFFAMKAMTWMLLRGQGVPANLLRDD